MKKPGTYAKAALVSLLVATSCEGGSPGTSTSGASSPLHAAVTLYDQDPGHLWNRIAGTLNTWTSKRDGRSITLEDPLLWPGDETSLTGECQRACLPLLDDFLSANA